MEKNIDRKFSVNETIALMHEERAGALRKIADHIEKFKMEWQEVAQLLREISDEAEAESIVVTLRVEINLQS